MPSTRSNRTTLSTRAAMAAKAEALIAAMARGDESWESARDDLSTWATASVTPALTAEAAHVITAAKQLTKTRSLAEAVDAEIAILTSLLREVAGANDGIRAAASARAARSVFDLHANNMTVRLVPLLAGESSVSLAELWTQVTSTATDAAPMNPETSTQTRSLPLHTCRRPRTQLHLRGIGRPRASGTGRANGPSCHSPCNCLRRA